VEDVKDYVGRCHACLEISLYAMLMMPYVAAVLCSASSGRAADLAEAAFALDTRESQLSSREAALAGASADLAAREAALLEGRQALQEGQEALTAAKLVMDQRETALIDKEVLLAAQVGARRCLSGGACYRVLPAEQFVSLRAGWLRHLLGQAVGSSAAGLLIPNACCCCCCPASSPPIQQHVLIVDLQPWKSFCEAVVVAYSQCRFACC